MRSATVVISWLVPLAAAQFVPPEVILQAGYPAGFRAFVPDFPGCELFGFHGKINSPFLGDEPGTLSNEILRPEDGFWTFRDLDVILSPGDIIHYWTQLVKDGVSFLKKNQTWKVPDPDESVDLLAPITLRPPKSTPEKMEEEPVTSSEEQTTAAMETTATNDDSTSPSSTEQTEPSSTVPSTTKLTTTTTKPTTTTTTTMKPTTTTPTTTQRPKPTKPKKSTPEPQSLEEAEEITTPALPFDKPITSEFPEEPLFPFPSLFPRPMKPLMPPNGPSFEICSNPWNFEERFGETRTQRLERQVAKLQCQLALFQRQYTQLSNTVENELTDIKKLVYGMVSRMARLESVLRSAAFG